MILGFLGKIKKNRKLYFPITIVSVLTAILTTLLFFAISGFVVFDYGYCKNITRNQSNLGGSPVINKDKISLGYTLFPSPPSEELKKKNKDKEGAVYLVDLYGNPVHTWSTKGRATYALLKKNGNLVVSLYVPTQDKTVPSGHTGIIQELDWDGNVIWEYKNDKLHHDFDVLPNGNIAVALLDVLPEDLAKSIQGGIPGSEVEGKMYADVIAEIDKGGNIVWQWQMKEDLDPYVDVMYDLAARWEWTHVNTVRYIARDPFNGEEAYLVSARTINTIFLVSKKDRKILWKSPNNLVSVQHDPSILPNGNILVFDNGYYRPQTREAFIGSQIVEIDPKQNKIVWEYRNGDTLPSMSSLIAPIMGGAQKLPNGNVLVTDSPKGHFFEVTEDKKLVWSLRNPFGRNNSTPYPDFYVFKAVRYSENEIDWPEKLSSPITSGFLLCDKLRK